MHKGTAQGEETVISLLPKLLHLSSCFDNKENEGLRQSYSTNLHSIAWFWRKKSQAFLSHLLNYTKTEIFLEF